MALIEIRFSPSVSRLRAPPDPHRVFSASNMGHANTAFLLAIAVPGTSTEGVWASPERARSNASVGLRLSPPVGFCVKQV
jgi:hypothetical protein